MTPGLSTPRSAIGMHPFVKILVVVNLLFAVGFWAYTASALGTQNRYRTDLETARSDAQAMQDRLEGELSALRSELQLTRDGRTTSDQRADQEKARADNLETQLADAKRANTRLQDDITKINNTLGDINATIAQVNEAKDRAVEQQRAAERARDEALAQQQAAELARRDATGGLTTAETQLQDLQAQLQEIQSELSRKEAQISTIVAQTGISLSDFVGQPQIEAAVVAIDTSLPPGLVVLNVGNESGVTRGMTFDVYSGNQYKGQVRVENVMGTRASALIVRQGSAPIAQGDRATTQL